MAELIMAARNGRVIPKEDKIFGISRRANEMIAEKGADAVTNATIGALLDDDGKLIVLTSVHDTFGKLNRKNMRVMRPLAEHLHLRKRL